MSLFFTHFTTLWCIFLPKKGHFSSLTRSTPPDPRWVLYLPGALALCPLLAPLSQPLSLAAGNIQAETLASFNIVFATLQQEITSNKDHNTFSTGKEISIFDNVLWWYVRGVYVS